MTPSRRPRIAPAADDGQTLSEYALLLSLIVIAMAAVVPSLVPGITGFFSSFAAVFGG